LTVLTVLIVFVEDLKKHDLLSDNLKARDGSASKNLAESFSISER